MAILAIKTSSYRNAVSRLHRRISQNMWSGLWPQLPVWEIPITSITNGVHLRTWINADLAELYDEYLQPDWRERYDDPKTWQMVDEIPDHELSEAHRRRKRRLINFIRERQVACAIARKAPATEVQRVSEVLDPDALTIGFARRFATYKRATLLFRDIDRLKRILCNTTPARAGGHRRQGPPQGPSRQDADPRDRAAFPRSRNFRSGWCSSRITGCEWRANWFRAWTCGSTTPGAGKKPAEPAA